MAKSVYTLTGSQKVLVVSATCNISHIFAHFSGLYNIWVSQPYFLIPIQWKPYCFNLTMMLPWKDNHDLSSSSRLKHGWHLKCHKRGVYFWTSSVIFQIYTLQNKLPEYCFLLKWLFRPLWLDWLQYILM